MITIPTPGGRPRFIVHYRARGGCVGATRSSREQPDPLQPGRARRDRGDRQRRSTSFVPFPSHEREAFNGLALAIVRGNKGEGGRIRVIASADGLKDGVAVVTSGIADGEP